MNTLNSLQELKKENDEEIQRLLDMNLYALDEDLLFRRIKLKRAINLVESEIKLKLMSK